MARRVLPEGSKALLRDIGAVPVEDDDGYLRILCGVPRWTHRLRGHHRRTLWRGDGEEDADTTGSIPQQTPQRFPSRGARSALADDGPGN